jgi:transposase-like protein
MSRGKKRYTEDFKRSAAKLAIESEEPVLKIAQNLGVSDKSVHTWIKEYYPNHKNRSIDEIELLKMREELKQLRKDNVRLKEERDILKKAAAYFASHPE